MRITSKALHGEISTQALATIEEKLAPVERVLGQDHSGALLELELERAPAEGRSSEPFRLVANLTVGAKVYHAEAVKPSPESAADRVRNELEAEVRRARGRTRHFIKRGGAALKNLFRSVE